MENNMCPMCNVEMVNGTCPQCGMKADNMNAGEETTTTEETS